jgi:capsular polysaccharide biosynthesis protein
MDLATLLPRVARRWWVVAAVAALALLGAGLAVGGRSGEHKSTMHFVLRPDASVPNRDLPGALEELKSDGPLVQTVIGVLDSQQMLQRAAANSSAPLTASYTTQSTARPGSALIDSTVTGPDAAVVQRLANGFTRAASDYVAANYSAYALDRLGAEAGGDGPTLSTAQVLILALLLGVVAGVGLVAAELRLEPQLRPLFERRAARRATAARDVQCRATTSKGAPCRNRAVDESGYCRMHLNRMEDERADHSAQNGSSEVIRLADPAVRALKPADRGRAPARRGDNG